MGEVLVEGRFEGEVRVGGVVRVASGGIVRGPVSASRVEVAGDVFGAVSGTEAVEVASGGAVHGDVRSPTVLVDDAGRVLGALRFDLDDAGGAAGAAQGLVWEGEVASPPPPDADAPAASSATAVRMPALGRRRARWRGGPLLLAAMALLAVACASHTLTLRPSARAFTPDDYEHIYAAWTRDAKAFSLGQLSDVLHVTATFESWEFRWAYVVRYASDYSLEPDAREAMLRASLADAQEHHRFFVTLAGDEYKESDLTGKQTAWRVLLIDSKGRQTSPSQIEKIHKPTPAERVYFPSINPWRHTFRVVFPVKRADGTPSIAGGPGSVAVLRFTGPRGKVDLRWKLSGG